MADCKDLMPVRLPKPPLEEVTAVPIPEKGSDNEDITSSDDGRSIEKISVNPCFDAGAQKLTTQASNQFRGLRQRNWENAKLIIMGKSDGFKKAYEPRKQIASGEEWEKERLRKSMLQNSIGRLHDLNQKPDTHDTRMERDEILRAVRNEYPILAKQIPYTGRTSPPSDSKAQAIHFHSPAAGPTLNTTQSRVPDSPKSDAKAVGMRQKASTKSIANEKKRMLADTVSSVSEACAKPLSDKRLSKLIKEPEKTCTRAALEDKPREVKAEVSNIIRAVEQQVGGDKAKKEALPIPTGIKRKLLDDMDEIDLDLQLEEVKLRAQLQEIMIRRQKRQLQKHRMAH